MRIAILIFILTGLTPSAFALGFPITPGQDVVGRLSAIETRYEDTFSDIARMFDVGYREMIAANPTVDAWLPGNGKEVIIPSRFILPPGPREGIVINLAELRLYYYPKGENRVITYPLGIGREGWSTPVGEAKIIRKKEFPTWTPPESIRQEALEEGEILPAKVGPGPENPLGDYAMYLTMPGYLMHGTNKPYGVGMRVSHGCIRLYPEDIANLFPQVPVGTKVRIINQPFKAGWLGGKLYVEVHPPLVEQKQQGSFNFTPLSQAIVQALGPRNVRIDWEKAKKIALEHSGIPEVLYDPTPRPVAAPQSFPTDSRFSGSIKFYTD